MRKWYKGEDNFGIALTPSEINPTDECFYSSASTNGKPYLEVEYASLAGVEGYWSFDSVSAGKAGTGQVNLATGNMVFMHGDTAMNGARMPVSVTHVYNSCDSAVDPFGCGFGWRTNFHQTLHKEYLDEKVYYVYTDGDGTEHWFKPNTDPATKYSDQSGLSMELVPGTTGITIRDKGDNVMTFPLISETPTAANPVTGKVLISSIADACGNTITVTGTGMKITQITDGAGRNTVYDYDNNDRLIAIRASWQLGAQDTPSVCFTYTDGNLTGIQYEDGNSSTYTYNQGMAQGVAHQLLTRAVGPEAIISDFTYGNTNVLYGLPHVVLTSKCWDGVSAVASHTAYEYGANLCLVTDQLTNNSLRYHFNDNGNCTSVDDGLGYAIFAEYDQSGANADAPINHATSTSRIQRVVNNLLKDGLLCKTSGSAWTKYGTGTVEQIINDGGFGRYQRKFTVTNGNTAYLRQTVSVEAEKTYTLSGYAQSFGAKAYLKVTAGAQTFRSIPVETLGTETQTDLERTQVTFTVPTSVTSISCDMVVEGTASGTIAWWDSAQLEEGETANHVNLIENSVMNRTSGSGLPDNWVPDDVSANYLSYQSRSNCTVPMPVCLPGNAMRVAGRFDHTIRGYQAINVAGNAGDKLTVGGWVSSYAKRLDSVNHIYCRLHVWFCHTNASGWSQWTLGGWADFNHEEGTWQFACGSITAPVDYRWVRVAIGLNKQLNYAEFSNLFLYKEQYGTDIVYDEKGNPKKSTAPSGISGQATYDPYNNVLTSCAPGHTSITNYHWGDTEAEKRKHLLQYSVSPTLIKSSYLYDAYGNVLQNKIEDSTGSLTKYIKSTATYTTAGTYVATQTDARGKVVTTVTDPDKGIVTKVTDPKGQEVNSQYDSLRRLMKTSTMLTSTQEVKSENTYDGTKGYLTSTTHNTDGTTTNNVTYNFAYDTLGRQVSVSVGSNVLSTTYYDAIKRMVDHVAFGNGGGVQYLYDGFNRVIGIRYDGATSNRFSYGYDAQGRVAYVIDHARGVTVYTDYDLAGRPCQKTHLLGTTHQYTGKLTYNQYELPDTFMEYVGATRAKHTTSFAYDEENRPTAVSYDAGSVAYTYDKIGRLTQRSVTTGSTPITTTYGYVDGGQGTNSTTGLIETITQNGVTLTYVYDDNGNITSVSDGTKTTSYEYDAIGQLIRVNDQTDTTAGTTGTTWVFTYDLGGNILTKAAYPYTTGTVGMTTESHTYTYGNAGWKDQLTAFDSVTIQYDAIGNPTNDGTWTYTWQHGKQLASISKTGETVAFEYNEDGLRTKKTATSTGTTEYTLHGKNIVHLKNGTDEMHFFYGAQNRPAIVLYNGNKYRYLYNLQGDVLGLVDESNNLVVEYRYDAWGKPTSKTGTMAGTLGTVQPFRYRGYVWDEEIKCYFISSRYYISERCRWVNEDAFVCTGQRSSECNMFTYCLNNPIDGYDPSGFARNNTDDNNGNRIPDYLEERWIELTNRYRAMLSGVECRDVTDEVNAALNNAISVLSEISSGNIWTFYEMVRNRGPWDIKRSESWEKTIGTEYPGTTETVIIYEGHYYTPEILGNYTYGVLGRVCGFDLDTLFWGSMYAAGFPKPGTSQYGNEMQDRLFIVNGFYRER